MNYRNSLLDKYEMKMLAILRQQSNKFRDSHDPKDLWELKRNASEWTRARSDRRVIREAATRTVPFVYWAAKAKASFWIHGEAR
jgi:hypothetical protein